MLFLVVSTVPTAKPVTTPNHREYRGNGGGGGGRYILRHWLIVIINVQNACQCNGKILLSPMIFSHQVAIHHSRKKLFLWLLLCINHNRNIKEEVRVSFGLNCEVFLHCIEFLQSFSVSFLEIVMMDDNCKLVLPVDPLDFLMNCDATLQPLPTCRVWVLVPDELEGVNELDKARNSGSLAMGLLGR